MIRLVELIEVQVANSCDISLSESIFVSVSALWEYIYGLMYFTVLINFIVAHL